MAKTKKTTAKKKAPAKPVKKVRKKATAKKTKAAAKKGNKSIPDEWIELFSQRLLSERIRLPNMKMVSDLTIAGLRENSVSRVTEGNEPSQPFTMNFNYYKRSGRVRVDRVTALNSSAITTPLQENLGGVDLMLIGDAFAFPRRIVKASLRYQQIAVAGNFNFTDEEFGTTLTRNYSDSEGFSIGIDRPLSLYDFLNSTHQTLSQMNPLIPLLQDIDKDNQATSLTITLIIHFTVTNTAGKTLNNRIRLIMRSL